MPALPGRPPDRDHWSRLRPMLEELLALESGAREAALVERFSDETDRTLAREFLAEADAEGTTRTSSLTPPIEVDPANIPVSGDIEPERVGPWELRRRIGAGGMGEVWYAVRADGHFLQRAALKRIRAEMVGAEIIARFERERQVLANLDHPGIARLLDGGVDEEGRPFLVMEYIDGIPIDRWCDERRLDVRARVQLLIEVARAVDAAHALLVVHRDIKPSNVLVDQSEHPRLIDFGVAKVLDPEKDAALLVTRDITRYVTPAYASPEQLTGERVSPASDVYSLGVLAYVLLAGETPLDVSGLPPIEAMRILLEDQPRPMSVAARDSTTAGLAETLRGDLDVVIGACLCKEPVRRYARAGDLADDLQRWLEGQPVRAHADGFLYRARRFVLRNRAIVTLTSIAFVSLLAGLLIVMSQRAQLRESRDALARRNIEAERLLGELRDSVSTMMADHYAELATIPGTNRVLGRMVKATSALAERQGDPFLLAKAVRAHSLYARSLWTPFRENDADPTAALAEHRRACEMAAIVAGLEAPARNSIWIVAESRYSALGAIFACGHLDEALTVAIDLGKWLAENVRDSSEEGRINGQPSYNASLLVQIATVEDIRARILAALGRSAEAEDILEKAIAESDRFDLSGRIVGLEMDDAMSSIYRQRAVLQSVRGEAGLARESLEKAALLRARAWAGHVQGQPRDDRFASNLLAEVSLMQMGGDASWIERLDATDPETGPGRGEGVALSDAERRVWARVTLVNRARLNGVAVDWDLREGRSAEAARHGRRAVKTLEALLSGRERAWVESGLLHSAWLVRGQTAVAVGDMLDASRFLSLAFAGAEEALVSESRDFNARKVAVDAALVLAGLGTDSSAKLDWARRARALISDVDCDDVGRRSLAPRQTAVDALLAGH